MSASFLASPARLQRWVVAAFTFLLLGLVVVSGATAPSAGADPPGPPVTITSASGTGSYKTGTVVAIHVGANSTFVPNSRIEVIECAAPNGVDPVSDATCDGNTAQAGSVLVAKDGSFDVPDYTLYALPNTTLAESADEIPVCNTTSECVLYIGQNQNDFKAPKVFSTTFTIEPTAATTPVAAHHGPVPGAPVTGVSARVAAAGASSGTPSQAAATPTTTPAASRPPASNPSTTPTSSGSSATRHASEPAVAGSASGPSGSLFSLDWQAVLLWLGVLGVLLTLIVVVGARWRRSVG
jgi:hypothetical protein